jgi:hypothetical protein
MSENKNGWTKWLAVALWSCVCAVALSFNQRIETNASTNISDHQKMVSDRIQMIADERKETNNKIEDMRLELIEQGRDISSIKAVVDRIERKL